MILTIRLNLPGKKDLRKDLSRVWSRVWSRGGRKHAKRNWPSPEIFYAWEYLSRSFHRLQGYLWKRWENF